MINIDRRLAKENLHARMILQVHDELVFELPKGRIESGLKTGREEMEGVHEIAVPLLVEVCSGPNWRDLD